jgi:hypothetical protein
MPKAKTQNSSGTKCSCNPVWTVAASIVTAVGIFLGIQGFVIQLQLQGTWDLSVLSWIVGYYFVGVLLVYAGKIMKMKACECCGPHGMCK